METPVSRPWCDYEGVEELGVADFEARDVGVGCYDPHGHARQMAAALAEVWGVNTNEAFDRAIRIHLATLIDRHDEFSGVREQYDIAYLIPPEGYELSLPDVGIDLVDEDLTPSITVNVPQSVAAIIGDLVEAGLIDSKSEFIHDAVRRLVTIKHMNSS